MDVAWAAGPQRTPETTLGRIWAWLNAFAEAADASPTDHLERRIMALEARLAAVEALGERAAATAPSDRAEG